MNCEVNLLFLNERGAIHRYKPISTELTKVFEISVSAIINNLKVEISHPGMIILIWVHLEVHQ